MKLDVHFEETGSSFPVTMLDNEVQLDVKFENLQVLHIDDADYYDGNTVVIPNFTLNVLKTAGKKMRSSVYVLPIPVSTVSNPQGGNTVFIGG